jgi:hypothetical protein
MLLVTSAPTDSPHRLPDKDVFREIALFVTEILGDIAPAIFRITDCFRLIAIVNAEHRLVTVHPNVINFFVTEGFGRL